ncbi:DUF4302 domain-containing protein [Flavihumibacter petaseus]|uniref:DUF4302 domain-containing protein n=1 Tax=Flavihumibacter petaseus NBRC 106054 TaxID=1220578 RepID=A0A0E9MYK4_9BACT|nr:DUF4302 domain-containing protein [Flavihumibacter petaseus]GAO42588.1 hypothetical protein FPE01S_01_16030 [Flavihumibacter petaseus NBRC 106054]
MKQRILLFALLTALLASCNKQKDPVFDESPDKRLQETLDKFQSTLEGAPFGWKALLKPAGLPNGIYSFYFKFKGGNRVDMFSDFNAASAATEMESSYRFKALQQPSLIFDTYSYLHVLADPDASKNGGTYGRGLGSDFEFAMEGISNDSVFLKGRFNGTRVTLVKATQEEADAYYNGDYRNRAFEHISDYLTYFKKLQYANQQYDITANIQAHTLIFNWKDGAGNPFSDTTGFYFSTDGIIIEPAFRDGNTVISSLDEMEWNATVRKLTFTINGNSSSILESVKPVYVDKNAARTWWNLAAANGFVWRSWKGFHVDGVDDAYGITKTADFNSLIFIPQFDAQDNITYDLLGGVIEQSGALGLSYGLATQPPRFLNDGRVVFPEFGVLGEIPEADAAAIENTFVAFLESEGFYVMATGENTADLVSAKDARSWISFVVWY